jgi:cellulose synthase operon protein C
LKSFLKGLVDKSALTASFGRGSGWALRDIGKVGVRRAAFVAVLLGGCFAMRAELSKWVENIDATSRLERGFFRTVVLATGSVPVRRPPKETRAELSKLIDATPSDADLYSLRALEAEQQLDFSAAEADWNAYAEKSADKMAARVALADYYHRRLESKQEFDALGAAALQNSPDSDKLLPDAEQMRWKIFEREIKLIDEQRLDPVPGLFQYNAWILNYPARPQLYQDFFRYAMDHRRLDVAGQIIEKFAADFPKDEEFPVEARAELAAKNGTPAQAVEVYERGFRPLLPPKLVAQYFEVLKQTGTLRVYLERARAGVTANPADLVSAARLFYYWQQQNNLQQAQRALTEFSARKETARSAWSTEELLTLARLYEIAHNYDEAARNYYAMYSVARAEDAAQTALESLARLLLAAPEQAIHFGSGNLSLYRDVATMDPHPGFMNGVVSLLMNNSDVANRYAQEEQSASAYFRRSRAADLVALVESRFPNSAARAELRERVIDSYAIYGSTDGVIREGTKFLGDFPDAQNRTAVAMRMADAYARTNQTREEFAIYDSLLAELAKRAGGVPLGALANGSKQTGARSPDYARVLDRYVARLVSMKRVPEALALYRRELDRNPNDAGLYDTLAAFLEQNKMGAEIEQVYQRAIAQFPDHTWEHKLARWYLRQKRQNDVSRLTRDVVRIFSGTELESYFREIVNPAAPVGPALYLQLNLFAHQRFPHNLTFARNLLNAYSAAATRDDAAYAALLRRHWYDAEDLRMRFFERLSRTRRLDAELSLIRTSKRDDPAAMRLLAEGEAWRGHFEAASPMFLALEADYPADRTVGVRTAALYRSLGTIDAKAIDTAIGVDEKLSQADPRDHRALTAIGEMEAERDHFDRAAAAWNKLAEIEPAKPDSYLEAATVFWDYFLYDDALRLIELGRERMQNPALFAYQAGAIHENQRDYFRAAREYASGALAVPGGSAAERRLISLARRPGLRGDIEQLTENLVSAKNPKESALGLRVALLRNQNQRDDLEKLLLAATARTDSAALLSAIENDARVDGFSKAQEAAMEREIAIALDPVERLRLRLAMVRFEESQGRAAQGSQLMDALYRENPALLGIVRAAVDYHWRNKNLKRAIDVLEEAAGRAAAGYRDPFILEAARKSIESSDYARARGFAAKLLTAEPNRAEYVAVMAETYARRGDDRGLRTFYDAKVHEMTAAHRTEDAAEMRRAVIPVLTRMKDYAGGVDQYIEIVNRYPEDDALAREAAIYASKNGLAARLRDYYVKASADSPKDFRWPMVLARIETQQEDYAGAIASYTRAAGVRPDRTDFLIARLTLEERLLRFDEAAGTATRLYDLAYHDPRWMEKLAEIRARQGRNADAVTALRKAWMEGHAESAALSVRMAQQLETWNILADARKYAEDAWKRSPEEGARMYVRVLMRQYEVDSALAALSRIKDTATVVAEIGATVDRYYSPQEKTKFAAAIVTQPQRIELAASAGLIDLQAKWLAAALNAAPDDDGAKEQKQKMIQLQRSRLRFDELGAQLEAYDAVLPPEARSDELTEAALCYRSRGNTAAELRVLQVQNGRAQLEGPLLERYSKLLIAKPQTLVATIAREKRGAAANGMLNHAVQHASAGTVQQAIAARGVREPALWTKAYTGLTGLYFATNTPAVKAAFTGVLGDMTIGSRLGKPMNRSQQMAGDLWFYYGGRFGEYLAANRQAGAEDYLPAMVEATPARSDAYFAMAEYFHDAGDDAAATADYRRALELDSTRADVHDRLATIAVKASNTEEAIREWRWAMTAFTDSMNRSRVPQTFWGDLSGTLEHIGAAKQLAPLKDDIDKLLRLYIRRNGAFQVEPLLKGVMAAAGDPAAGVDWIAELSRSAAAPGQILSLLLQEPWVPEAQHDVVYRRIVESAQAQVARSFGEEQSNAQSEVWRWQVSWAEYLLTRKENQRAADIVAAFSDAARKQHKSEIIELEMRLAARNGRIAAQLARYGEPAPIEDLRRAAAALTRDGDAASARRVLEFIYDRALSAGDVGASNFLGLAEIRLEENNLADAMTLLRRMALVSGDGFASLDPAAVLLEKTGHPAEAIEFLAALVKAEPWNMDARERLASAEKSRDALAAIAKSVEVPYRVRVAAALAIRKMNGPALNGTEAELALLSSPDPPTEASVSQPYFLAARVEAAHVFRDSGARERVLAGAIALDPANSGLKIELFRTALENRHDATAVGVAQNLLPPFLGEDTAFSTWNSDAFLNGASHADQLAVARGMSQAEQRLGNLQAALLYGQIAQRIEPDAAIGRALDAIRARVETEKTNDARRPVVSDHLDQDRLVHPKVGVR